MTGREGVIAPVDECEAPRTDSLRDPAAERVARSPDGRRSQRDRAESWRVRGKHRRFRLRLAGKVTGKAVRIGRRRFIRVADRRAAIIHDDSRGAQVYEGFRPGVACRAQKRSGAGYVRAEIGFSRAGKLEAGGGVDDGINCRKRKPFGVFQVASHRYGTQRLQFFVGTDGSCQGKHLVPFLPQFRYQARAKKTGTSGHENPHDRFFLCAGEQISCMARSRRPAMIAGAGGCICSATCMEAVT